MKTYPFLLLAGFVACACQKESIPASPDATSNNPITKAFLATETLDTSMKNVSQVDLSKITGGKNNIVFGVSLKTIQGDLLTENTSIQPNTLYKVVIQGESPARFIIKMAENFEIVQTPPAAYSSKVEYIIKTKEKVTPQLYLSVVPLHEENNVMTRQRPTGFLLPN